MSGIEFSLIISTVAQWLEKLVGRFVSKMSASTVMTNLFSLRQAEGEDISSFAARLEDCAFQAVRMNRMREEEVETRLREAFFGGVRPSVKASVTFLLEDEAMTFARLVARVKNVENELALAGSAKAYSALGHEASHPDPMQAQIDKLTREIELMKASSASAQSSPVLPLGPPRFGSPVVPPQGPSRRQDSNRRRRRPICHRCHQEGHIAIGCRMFDDDDRQALNGQAPVSTGNSQGQSRRPYSGRRR